MLIKNLPDFFKITEREVNCGLYKKINSYDVTIPENTNNECKIYKLVGSNIEDYFNELITIKSSLDFMNNYDKIIIYDSLEDMVRENFDCIL